MQTFVSVQKLVWENFAVLGENLPLAGLDKILLFCTPENLETPIQMIDRKSKSQFSIKDKY